MSRRRHRAGAYGALAIITTSSVTALAVQIGPAQAASTGVTARDAQVSVLHAVPGATVDVYANGKALLTNFKPGTLTDPVKLPSGSYDLKVTAAGAGGAAVIQANGVEVPAGANVTVVAHLTAAGKPQLTPFANDTSKVLAGKARLTVRHTAAAPAVDIRAASTPVFKGLTNPKEAISEVDAGTVKADVVLAGTSTVAIGPASLSLTEGSSTIVYAWGSASDKNLKLAVQNISGLHSNPHGIPGGTGGQASRAGQGGLGSDDLPVWLLIVMLGVAGGSVATATAITVRGSRSRS